MHEPDLLAAAQANLKANPQSADSWNRVAIAYLKEGNLAAAVEHISHAIVLEPQDPLNYSNRGRMLFALERLPESLADYSKAIELEPTAELYATRSVVNLAMGKNAAALSDLNDAYDLNPSIENLLNRASFFSNKGMAADALRDVNTVVEREPDKADYRLTRANLSFALARYQPELYEQGISDIQRALELDHANTLQPSLLQLADQLETYLPDSPNPTVSRRLIELIRLKK